MFKCLVKHTKHLLNNLVDKYKAMILEKSLTNQTPGT